MKRIILCLAIMMQGVLCHAEEITVCKWTVSAIVEAVDPKGNVSYSVHYKGQSYELTHDQYEDLMCGYDIILKKEGV